MTWIISKLIDWISLPLGVIDFLRRHATIRSIILWIVILSVVIVINFGFVVWVGIVGFVGRMAFMMVFMIAQFAVLFMFLSSTKTIETVPGDKGLVSFEKDYFGNEYLVDAVREWISSLSIEGKQKLDAMGAEAISGILLEGPPGTGKTLLAQCLATDSNAAFFGTSGSDYQAMFIGVGPMKVMRMYSKARAAARRYGAAIVFIDELDAIGGNRGGVAGDRPVAGGMAGGMFGGGGLGVLSKLLTELDGTKEVGRRDQIRNRMRKWFGLPELRRGLVLTIGATNRFDALDRALVRPGRIDKIIRVDSPDKTSRQKIIAGYLGKVKHDDSIVVDELVEDTGGVTPAQIASAIQRSAPRHAINSGRDYITVQDIEAAFQEDLVGLRNPISDFDPEQERQVAVHEAGHAIASYVLRPERRITHVSIVRRGSGILGYVRDVEQKEIYAIPLKRLAANIMVSIAGHIATEMVLGEPWSGADSDFNHVRFFMERLRDLGEFGGIPFEPGWTSTRIKERADKWLQDAIKGTRKVLDEHRELLLVVADALVERKELSRADFYQLVGEYNERKS